MSVQPCQPEVREGALGWLAASPADHPYRIGVVGTNRDEAYRRFATAFAAWEELHERAEAEA
jgi:hypothetical protein